MAEKLKLNSAWGESKLSAALPGLDAPSEAANPFEDIDYGEGLEIDSGKEMDALLVSFRDRLRAGQAAVKNVADSEYWFAVAFRSREQKERFLRAMDWIKHGDKYFDGTALAKQHKIELPAVAPVSAADVVDKTFGKFPIIE